MLWQQLCLLLTYDYYCVLEVHIATPKHLHGSRLSHAKLRKVCCGERVENDIMYD